MTQLLPLVAIAAGGAAIALQAPINAALSRQVGGPILATAISFGVGFVALALAAGLRGAGQPGALLSAPVWMWTGGLLGAFYLACMVWAVPSVGVATAIATLVLGQLLAALALDASGAFGMEVRAIDARRVLAVALVAAGVILSRR